MSAVKETQGPWESVGGYVRTPLDTRGGGWMIADCRDSSRPWDEIYANAALIAAAPDLLDALAYAIDQVPELATVPGIASAIAKATGEQP